MIRLDWVLNFAKAFLGPMSLVSAFSVTAIAQQADWKEIETSFLKMRLPAHWKCELRNTEWMCHDQRAGKNQRALVILSAKEASPEDIIENFKKYLTQPRLRTEKTGASKTSRVLQVTSRKIGDQEWVEAVHLDSEVDNYYSRYLATRYLDWAVLVNFTVHKNAASQYGPEFLQAITTLVPKNPPTPPATNVSDGSQSMDEIPPLHQGSGIDLILWVAIVLFVIALASVFFLRRPRRSRHKKSR